MKVSIDTKEDSHDDIKNVIKMLQHLVGDSQEVFTNEPLISAPSVQETQASPLANIFGDISAQQPATASEVTQTTQETADEPQTEETSQSTEDLFAELFSEEELKKMDVKKEDEEEVKPAKGKKYGIELY